MFFDGKTSRTSRSQSTSTRGTEQDSAFDGRKKRVLRSCDMCRLKKLKCEGGHPSRKACIHCILNGFDCTFLQMAKNELREQAYVQSLEIRLENMEKLVRKWCPDLEASQDLSDVEPSPVKVATNSTPPLISSGPRLSEISTAADHDDVDSDDDETSAHQTVSDYLQGFDLSPQVPPLVGKSSALMLLHTVLDSKSGDLNDQHSHMTRIMREGIPRFWESFTWESRPSGPIHHFTFPEVDLMPVLVDNYFKNANAHYLLLHRPTFENNMSRGLHLSDEGFGATLLLVCALGSRESDDPRIYSPDEELGYMPGGRWFIQVQRTLKFVVFEEPRLYDLQIAALAAIFATRTPAPQLTCWLIVGHGIRSAQVLDAHRRKVYAGMPPVERELMKRVFWNLIKLDRHLSYYMGRPCTIRDEDFDVDLPIECDDEYWTPEDPALAFKQPEGKPAKIMFFNWGIRLSQIQSYAMRTIYSITKARAALGRGTQWEAGTVIELDSALNKWHESLPEPLRWNPKEKDFAILARAAGLHVEFWNLQMVVHRPFMSRHGQKATSFPSLTVCTNAARSALRILDVQFMRATEENQQRIASLATIVVAGMLLLFNILASRRLELPQPNADIELISKAVYMIMSLDYASPAKITACDSLVQLIRISGLPVPHASDSPYRRDIRPQEPSASNVNVWEAQDAAAHHPDATFQTFSTPSIAAEPIGNVGAWDSFSFVGPSTHASFGGEIGSLPQSSGTADDILRTLEGLSAQRPSIPSLVPSDAASGWSPPVMEQGGFGNLGFQWEEWGSLFANAFGVEEPGIWQG